ncbi:GH25 family lysozyme M1 (1,4-beta-N-acetylmuramidase) [Catenulispora sp. EB89]|uniref:GH25 family lysozyme n=1 Tax=Catenulispora sp. EB89 TaxID=3156257 RepID=UPI003511C55D
MPTSTHGTRGTHGTRTTRRLAVLALAVATAGTVLLPATSGAASTSAKATSVKATSAEPASVPGAPTVHANPHPGYARTVTGKLVKVDTTRHTTPVHPTVATHPQLDYMGSTIPAHEPVARPALKPFSAASVPQLPGIDVSAYQGNLNWAGIAPNIDFSYTKATEGTYYTNQDFYNQYVGPYDQGLIRGAYHFANPSDSSGATQADYFVNNGGGWSSDGLTLPGALDIEYNPYGSECYGLSGSQMSSWIWDFVNEYASRTGVYPVIYSTTDWWNTCTSDDTNFANYTPLWIANYVASGGGTLPPGWGWYTFWQYADSGSQPGDQDVFNGPYSQLQVLARNG